MKKNTWYVVAVVAVVVVVFAIARTRNSTTKTEVTPVSNTSTQNPSQPKAGNSATEGTYWEGTLKASDSAKKGNLMLVTDKTTVYINTSRDYSALIGKKVKVTYQGTLASFTMMDITAE
jgi:hypothetical protein